MKIPVLFVISLFCLFPFIDSAQASFRPKQILSSNILENRSEGKIRNVFYHHSFGGCILALGEGTMASLNNFTDVGLGIYYAPKIAFRIGYMNSVCVGLNVQAMLNSSSGLILTHPFTVGFNRGSCANKENEELFGWFVNGGVGPAFILSTDPDDSDGTSIFGPYADFGVRLLDYEAKISVMKSFKNRNEAFLITAGVGIVF